MGWAQLSRSVITASALARAVLPVPVGVTVQLLVITILFKRLG